MPAARYPMETPLRLRSADVERCEQALRCATKDRANAEAKRNAIVQDLSAHRGREELAYRGVAGIEARGSDCVRRAAHQRRLRAEREELETRAREAADELRRSHEHATEARRKLAVAKAELEALEAHRARWDQEQCRRQEARVQDEIDDEAALRGLPSEGWARRS